MIPPQDYDFLYKAGVSAVFGPGKISLTTYKLQNDTFIVLFMNCDSFDITLEVDVSDELFFRIHVPVSKGILWSLNYFMLKTKITNNMIH